MDAGYGWAVIIGIVGIAAFCLAVIGAIFGAVMWGMGWTLFGGYDPAWMFWPCLAIIAFMTLWGRWK